jgi:hypothetical protein
VAYTTIHETDANAWGLRSGITYKITREKAKKDSNLRFHFCRSDEEEWGAEGEPDFDRHWNFAGVILVDKDKRHKIFLDMPAYSQVASDGKALTAVMKAFEDGWLEGIYHIIRQE